MNYKLFFVVGILVLAGCKEDSNFLSSRISIKREPTTKSVKTTTKNINKPDQMAINIENATGKPVYVASFTYLKKSLFESWRWDKSPIQKILPGSKTTIPIDQIPDQDDLNNTYSFLGVFDTPEKAENSTYELLTDDQRIDLDHLINVKDKTIVLRVNRYGYQREKIVYDSKSTKDTRKPMPELDFTVKNLTGKKVYVVGFFYSQEQYEEDLATWNFVKTNIIELDNQQEATLDVQTILDQYDWEYMRGYLGVFQDNERELAEVATYELLKPYQKVTLGPLSKVRQKRVVLRVEEYGVANQIIEALTDNHP